MQRRQLLAELARRGAALRLAELESELKQLYKLAPELFLAPPHIERRKRPRGRPRSERRRKLPKSDADCRVVGSSVH
jgi:hypothetical protein